MNRRSFGGVSNFKPVLELPEGHEAHKHFNPDAYRDAQLYQDHPDYYRRFNPPIEWACFNYWRENPQWKGQLVWHGKQRMVVMHNDPKIHQNSVWGLTTHSVNVQSYFSRCMPYDWSADNEFTGTVDIHFNFVTSGLVLFGHGGGQNISLHRWMPSFNKKGDIKIMHQQNTRELGCYPNIPLDLEILALNWMRYNQDDILKRDCYKEQE